MKLLDRLLDFFGKRRSLLLGATTHPNDLKATLHAIRARTYLKITGKALPTTSLPKTSTEGAEDLTDSLSPSRRLLRKDF